ncbi:urease accessory protein [Isoptericola sp. CG 20/1183]|uniref:Urease accessory protein n=1 Tax=Isoptericola halotolerans TaxID=300560 RepID=A0ABX5EFC2_9MICO|nr:MULTISPECIES: urease accessory UreF family protein [Isoptericola]MCK0117927.1 urease accessory protein [Isoptericola sp. S6320L]PRZ07008.1 urease accessory protein [Isoptericola halotolerans]PRZ07320.1 urease accessory protein [Isoptericola sp. CG 20/1183]
MPTPPPATTRSAERTAPAPGTVALLLADARLPGGGHAHSASLEPALLGGLPVDDVPAWMAGRATTVSLVEAGTAVVTAHVLTTGGAHGLDAVARAWAARTPSGALRDAARLLGRGYLRVARTLWADHHAVAAAAGLAVRHGSVPRAVVLGAVAAACGLGPADLVRLTVYDDAQTAASALLKLEPLDPLVPARWVLDACAAAEPHVARVAACTTPDDIPSSGAPLTEGWAEAHALTQQRLFRA